MAETMTANATAAGKVIAIHEGVAIFQPAGTNYELQLLAPGFAGPLHVPVRCIIRVQARKVYTVPSGGNFIVPIFGPPRIVQGRVRAADAHALVVQAGCPIHVELPGAESAIDLDDGPIYLGRMVNVVCQPAARAEFL